MYLFSTYADRGRREAMTTEVSLLCEAGARSECVNVNVAEPLIGS